MRSLAKFAMVLSLGMIPPAFGADNALLKNGFAIRHEHRETRGELIRLYLTPGNESFVDVPSSEITGYERVVELANVQEPTLPEPATDIFSLVDEASQRLALDSDLIRSVIRAESGFNSRAVSPKGARGLMQLMPQTARRLGVDDVFDPRANIDGGTRHLRALLERYNFDLIKALAAYNAGTERVDHYNGVPPYRETQLYVARIVREYNAKKLEQMAQQKKAKISKNAKSTD